MASEKKPFDAQTLVDELIAEHFERDASTLSAESAIAELGDDDAVEAFCDALTSRLDTFSLTDDERAEKLPTVGAAVKFANGVHREKLAQNWESGLAPAQLWLFKVAPVVGVVAFIVGVQLKVRGLPWAEPLMGVGMFVAVQMYWGVRGGYEWLAKRYPTLVERFGTAKLFGFVLVAAYLLSFLEIGLVLAILGLSN